MSLVIPLGAGTIWWGKGRGGEGVVKKRESPDLRSPVVGISAIVKYGTQHGFLLHTKNDRF